MPETYLTGGDTLIEAKNEVWLGQSFQVLEPMILQFIDLELRGSIRSPDPLISVWEADSGNIPQGDTISINRHTVESKAGFFTTGRVRFSMTPVKLNTGQNYVLMVRNFPPLGGNQLSWQYDQGDADYPRGNRIHSVNGGLIWTNHPGDDFLFALFGDPPLTKPEPPPPIDNFATIDLSFSHAPTSITISLITSVPCHLSCYYTDKKPLSHHTSRLVRGLAVPWGTYFCFVAWTPVEQIEEGDTISHTFYILNWSYCQTKWFTFRGTVDLVTSPSVGPIFKHHHSGYVSPYPYKDTFILSYVADSNYGDAPDLVARDGAGDFARSILSFVLDEGILPDSVVRATLSIYFYWNPLWPHTGKVVNVHKCTRPYWIESEATWNSYQTINPWTTPGGDFESFDPPPASFNMPASYGWIDIDVKQLVQDALTRRQYVHFLLKFKNETAGSGDYSICLFRSNDYTTDPALRPKLIISTH